MNYSCNQDFYTSYFKNVLMSAFYVCILMQTMNVILVVMDSTFLFIEKQFKEGFKNKNNKANKHKENLYV